MSTWRVLQLADSAFPTGGFAHSGGLEAALHAGTASAATLGSFVVDTITATAHASLPIVGAAWHADGPRLTELDAFTAATLWSHVAARASRTQGRAWIDVTARAFSPFGEASRGQPVLVELRRRVIAETQPGHLAPMFGAVARALDVAHDDAYRMFLHLTVRGLLSAAVRLGTIGPTEAQAVHGRIAPALEDALELARALTIADVAQTAPLTELVQAGHDRLYTRLFQT
jgi:urease accessory protein